MRPTDLKKGSAELLILSLLEGGSRHGYELCKLIETRWNAAVGFRDAGWKRPASGAAAITGSPRRARKCSRHSERAGSHSSTASAASWNPDMSDPQQWRRELAARLAGLDNDGGRVHQIIEELSQHLDDRYAELVESGMAAEKARGVVLEELAGRDVLRRAIASIQQPAVPSRQVPGTPVAGGWLSGLGSDVRDGFRGLRASPLLTAVALLTLSVGI